MLLLFLHCGKKTLFNLIVKREKKNKKTKKKISFNIIVKREKKYKQTKMTEIKSYI